MHAEGGPTLLVTVTQAPAPRKGIWCVKHCGWTWLWYRSDSSALAVLACCRRGLCRRIQSGAAPAWPHVNHSLKAVPQSARWALGVSETPVRGVRDGLWAVFGQSPSASFGQTL